jgi:TIR domain
MGGRNDLRGGGGGGARWPTVALLRDAVRLVTIERIVERGTTVPNVRVFVSYAHEDDAHRTRVTALIEDLRANGVDARFDRDVNGTPREGWPRWMEEQVAQAVHVLVVCTETYLRRYDLRETPGKGKGAIWEGSIVRQEMYDA